MQGDKHNNWENENKSTAAVLLEIAKLLILLLWKGVKALGRLILKGLLLLLKLLVKGLLWVIDSVERAIKRFKVFWNDNSTQQKRKKIGRGIKKACQATLTAIWVSIVYMGKAIIWLLKKTFKGLIHLKSTLKTIWTWTVKAVKGFGRWINKTLKAVAAWWEKKKYQYRSFRRNQGFKGMLLDMRDGLKGEISNYIEDDQQADDNKGKDGTQEHKEIVDGVLGFTELDDEDEDNENMGGFKKIGRRIYRSMKRLVEE